MSYNMYNATNQTVALRKESVDRNEPEKTITPKAYVALRKESVDRNEWTVNIKTERVSRSPQGERG